MSALLSVAVLVTMAYLLSNYHKESIEAPWTELPLQTIPDVKRWRHDGSQPKHERLGNRFPAVVWPEIDELNL